MSSISDISDPSVNPPIRPTASFMWRHPAHAIALGFGSGLSPKAPGTVGSLWGWASWLLIQNNLSLNAQAALLLVSLFIGWWACTLTAKNMGVSDPGSIVWDEIVAMWLILFLMMPAGFMAQLSAFLLFRFFDAAKPGPVAWADRLFKGFGWRGGWGILFDDLVAAFCTLLVLALWRWF
ncbi:phosphatidylglycerophosphatase A [Limnohabitans sp. Bal53]|uniref:phosphatidylglycerophosphatase A family protein n=1 Tax=Limnohabitans sp. Bal53 TaxID=1977910 RepID=UPI000D3349C4|nr:phosphatidylglycerophosphatase A [Limnohabitans sp. Bal53]PUE39441.1 phosphatidylglycerophosphatase A [Limnohabitans sp. Bal53]